MDGERWSLTCLPCRFGDHAHCVEYFTITGTVLDGRHRCACTAPGHPVSNQQGKEPRP